MVQQQALLLPCSSCCCRAWTDLRRGSRIGYSWSGGGKGIRLRARVHPEEEEILPNALRRKKDPLWRGGFSLGVDLGMSRTGLALSKGFSPRPLTVLELRGRKLEVRLLDIAEEEEADEFIIGLPISRGGKENPQSNKVRSIVGRFAVLAAERGWRVYLQDEYGTSNEALDFMIDGWSWRDILKCQVRGLNSSFPNSQSYKKNFEEFLPGGITTILELAGLEREPQILDRTSRHARDMQQNLFWHPSCSRERYSAFAGIKTKVK
ncbi:uncharacterized protein LOC131233951 [Magnolia sinica]|uniref:uncharacterized protein LOC131233951 n=1 Tax=Magnolia sinica TaxID=86752 RepID=UPI002657C333|nr:uncharacterized protein LOC131233951 [Magnolia sinica]